MDTICEDHGQPPAEHPKSKSRYSTMGTETGKHRHPARRCGRERGDSRRMSGVTTSDDPDTAALGTGGLSARKLPARITADALFALFPGERAILVELDAAHRIVRCNQGYAMACGQQPERVAGALPAELVAIQLIGPSGERRAMPASSADYPYATREQWRRTDGGLRAITWLELWEAEDRIGTRYIKLGFGSDHEADDTESGIGARIQLQSHVSRAIALGEMASSIAHEINQPLTAIVSYADASKKLLDTGKHTPETLGRALQRISEQGKRAGQVIQRLREFVKKKQPTRADVNPNELIRAATALTAHDAERHGVKLEFELEKEPIPVRVDRHEIEIAILNLIRNSIEAIVDAGRRPGNIRVTSRIKGDVLEIGVSDNGPGIPAASTSDIFHPFFTTKKKGTGLGLSVSQAIAQAHGGELALEPNSGQGVTFTLAMPVTQND